MKGIFDDNKLDIECPNCKKKFRIAIRELRKPGVKCPGCDAEFETSQFNKALEEVDRQVKDFKKKLR